MQHNIAEESKKTQEVNKTSTIKGFEKIKLIFILALMSSIAPLSTDMYLPALPSVSKKFAVDDFYTQLSLASFFIAFAFGQLIYGPLSDVFGRKKPLYIGVSLFIISSIGCVLVDSIYAFIALRFFEALGGCAGVVIARAIVNDRFMLQEAAAIFALMMVFSSLAPMLSPFFGAVLLEFFSWHSIFMTLFLLGIALLLLIIFALKESAPHLMREKFSHRETIKTYQIILRDKVFTVYVFSGALAMAAMFAYITGSSFCFMNVFGLSKNTYSIIFALNALGFVVCANINAKFVLKTSPFIILPRAFVAMSVFAVLLVVAGLLCHFSLQSSDEVVQFSGYFFLFEITLFLTISMLGFLLPNLTTLAMARFKQCSGTASAILGTTQFALAGIMSFLVGVFHANTPWLLACMMALSVLAGSGLYFGLGRNNSAM
ncbi:multidrug effflux MFS transporter [Helicobacter sp. MIT 14-3879]|uniref:multidrug effflux MFS transporter n=1 Tax=Helicobacter sp. MIT 14-3879 TaxID=2040649 RepID=UPI000E1F6E61|nr:multidrug effflux MFS transporter [Helicobacter sp. MIT 14-3879]RDU59978.1 Bcr/CflA family drug resistance efflux transporter [Helicobacter sp. MIT 14-3879]